MTRDIRINTMPRVVHLDPRVFFRLPAGPPARGFDTYKTCRLLLEALSRTDTSLISYPKTPQHGQSMYSYQHPTLPTTATPHKTTLGYKNIDSGVCKVSVGPKGRQVTRPATQPVPLGPVGISRVGSGRDCSHLMGWVGS